MPGVPGSITLPPEHDGPSLAPGTVLGGYTIGECLGAGGLAEVYSAKDSFADREIALKTLHLKYCALSEFVERMQQEAVVTTRIRHPNVVTCWAAGLDGTRPWLALERLRGVTMRQKLEDGPLWPHDLLSLARQAASGLRAAHARGIFHRDLKPENLFIERRRLVLLDFGLAKSSKHAPLTDPFVAPGTIAYMAPEQILRRPADARTDIYALGICMYEALAGHHPFVNEPCVWPDDDVMARFHLEDPPCPLPELIEGFPRSIWAVVDRCLAKNPARRYADMLELGADLARHTRTKVSLPTDRKGHSAPLQRKSELLSRQRDLRQAEKRERGDERQVADPAVIQAPRGSVGYVGVDETVAWMEVAGCCLYVSGTRAPSNLDWDAYLDWLLPRCEPGALVRTLVLEHSSGPSAAQRIRLSKISSKCAGRVAVVTPSPVVRGIVTAWNWLKAGSYRAFAPDQLAQAIGFLAPRGIDARATIVQAAEHLVSVLQV